MGLLALISVPKLIGYTEEARQAKILNDAKIAEQNTEIYLLEHNKLPDDLPVKLISELEKAREENKLYNTNGLVPEDEVFEGDFKVLEGSIKEELIKTDLKGMFYGNDKGKIYYEDIKASKETAPIITINDYIKTPTNQDITVYAKTDKGELNQDSYTFTENGSFTFIAKYKGLETKMNVIINNIDKVAPEITITKSTTLPTYEPVIVTATTNKGNLNNNTFTFNENGIYEFIATDNAGNETKEKVIVDNILSKKLITKELLNQNSLSEIIELTKLNRVYNISTNTGEISYSQNGEEVTIEVTNASSEGTILNPKKYSKVVNSTETNNKDNFNDAIEYSSDGYSGTLTKDGDAEVISGSYIPASSKTITDTRTSQGSDTTPDSLSYDQAGYKGTLNKVNIETNKVLTGGSEAGSKYVTGQTSANYDDGVYSGTLEQYVYSGTYTPADTKTIKETVIQSNSSFPNSISYDKDGYKGTLDKSGTAKTTTSVTYDRYNANYGLTWTGSISYLTSIPATTVYTSYTGTDPNSLRVSGTSYYVGGLSGKEIDDLLPTFVYYTYGGTVRRWQTTVSEPSGNYPYGFRSHPEWGYKRGSLIESGIVASDGTYPNNGVHTDGYWYIKTTGTTYTQDYTGTVTKPEVDTRVYRYKGTVTKPDTRIYRTDYTAHYEGIVTKPAIDTRIWKQRYKGTVYKEGYDDLYKYNIEVEYFKRPE